MAELTVEDVVFTLKELGIELNSKLLRRIEWSLGEGNYDRSEERLKEELSDFVLRKSRFRYLVASEISLDDFLCEKGISLAQYRQLIHSLSTPSHYPSLLNTTALESFDSDSSILRFAQHNLELNVILAKLRELGLSHVQCRVILGLGTKSYERLKKQNQELRRDEVSRTGRSENDAWSFAKHVVSELCLGLFKGSSGSPITILETHQGIGDATFLYRYHGNVLGFDNHEETHQLLLDRVQKSGFYRNTRELYLKRFSSTPKDAGPFVFLSEEPTPCEQGLQAAITQGLSFDAVDVDPWTTSQPYFSDVLRVLADQGLVMLTLGDQHP